MTYYAPKNTRGIDHTSSKQPQTPLQPPMIELLYLNEGDTTELLDMPEALSVVEGAFLEHDMGRV